MELSELLEGAGEWESESEAAEARRGGNVRRPSSQPSFRPRPAPSTPQYVTQTQLEAALTRSDGKIKTVADGVTQINTRLNGLAVAAKKEADERKKTLDAQNKDMNQKLQLMAMLPVLTTPPSATVAGTSVLIPDTSSLDKLLPLLLVSGLGGTGGFGGSSDSSGDGGSGMMMMALVLALAK
jgi:hypothetical protein